MSVTKPSDGSEPGPHRGDVSVVDLNPVIGTAMRDRHPCVVNTPRDVNAIGVCLVVPITTGSMFVRKAGLAMNISGQKTNGVALCDQVGGLDIAGWVKRNGPA